MVRGVAVTSVEVVRSGAVRPPRWSGETSETELTSEIKPGPKSSACRLTSPRPYRDLPRCISISARRRRRQVGSRRGCTRQTLVPLMKHEQLWLVEVPRTAPPRRRRWRVESASGVMPKAPPAAVLPLMPRVALRRTPAYSIAPRQLKSNVRREGFRIITYFHDRPDVRRLLMTHRGAEGAGEVPCSPTGGERHVPS